MASFSASCLVCGRRYITHDAAPRFFCSVGCEVDAGCDDVWAHEPSRRSRPAFTIRVLHFSCSQCNHREQVDVATAAADERSSGQLCPQCGVGILTSSSTIMTTGTNNG
jgi:hypothetical protein